MFFLSEWAGECDDDDNDNDGVFHPLPRSFPPNLRFPHFPPFLSLSFLPPHNSSSFNILVAKCVCFWLLLDCFKVGFCLISHCANSYILEPRRKKGIFLHLFSSFAGKLGKPFFLPWKSRFLWKLFLAALHFIFFLVFQGRFLDHSFKNFFFFTNWSFRVVSVPETNKKWNPCLRN